MIFVNPSDGISFSVSSPSGNTINTNGIHLKVNGEVKQDGDLEQMIWNVPETISKLSEMVELAPGDIIMTGTPAGVSALQPGHKLDCEVEGVGKVSVTIGAKV